MAVGKHLTGAASGPADAGDGGTELCGTARFTAAAAEASDDGDLVVAAVTDGGGGDGDYLLLIRPSKPGGPDDAGVYVERNARDHAAHDAVRSCDLSRDALTLTLTEPLGGADRVEVDLKSLNRAGRRALTGALRKIFRGRPGLTVSG